MTQPPDWLTPTRSGLYCEAGGFFVDPTRAVDRAVQVHGALGLEAGSLVAELYREVRSLRIYEGASEIQRTIVARGLFRGLEDGVEVGGEGRDA